MNLALKFSDEMGGAGPGRILDIRSVTEFQAGHLPGAVSHPVAPPPPGSDSGSHFELALPSIYLPPREVALLIVGDKTALSAALADHLQTRGRAAVRWVAIEELAGESLLATGPSRAHLWEPPSWLIDHVALLPPPAAGPVVDLACGSGRAAVWLAERGYRVTGVDWQPEALELGRQLAVNRGVEVSWHQADLREKASWPQGPWAAILNFRYLHRELLAQTGTMLQSGGVAMVRTFRDVPGYEGHPHRRHRLLPYELLRNFSVGQYEVLAHEQGFDPDGRSAAGIVARHR